MPRREASSSRRSRGKANPEAAIEKQQELPITLVASSAAVLLIVYALLVLANMQVNVATADEPIHMFAGYSDLRWGDRRVNPEHPPLVKKLAALPLLSMKLWPSSLRADSRDDERLGGPTFDEMRRAWDLIFIDPDVLFPLSHDFLFGFRREVYARHGVDDPLYLPPAAKYVRGDFLNDADAMLFRARMPMLLISILLGVLIFSWSRELFGGLGALLSLALFAFDPNFIGNGGLVTTDVPVAAFILGAIYFLWRAFERLTLLNVFMTIGFFSLALTSKYSAVLLIPIMLWLGVRRAFSSETWVAGRGESTLETLPRRIVAILGFVVATVAVSWVAVWAVYGFRYSAAADLDRTAMAQDMAMARRNLQVHIAPSGHYPLRLAFLRDAALQSLIEETGDYPSPDAINARMRAAELGLGAKWILRAGESHWLPEGFVYGIALARIGAQGRSAFLRGENSQVGFPSYFLWTFLLKTPLVTMALCLLAILSLLRGKAGRGAGWFLLFPAVVFFFFALSSRLNIGHRHLLPIYPFLFVAAGALAGWSRGFEPRLRWWITAIVPAAIAVGALFVFAPPWRPSMVYAHHLEYFNELAGGPVNGYRSLVDSNVDWGQDLRLLKRWTEEQGVSEPINLCYFGTADPRYYGLRHRNLLGGYPGELDQGVDAIRPGLLAMSVTNLEGVTSPMAQRGRYSTLLAESRARLIGRVGYSILLYRLGEERPAPSR